MSNAAGRALALLVTILLVVTPVLSHMPGAGGRVTRNFDGGNREVDLDFPTGTESYTVSVTIPRAARLSSAEFGVSGKPLGSILQYPRSPAVDIGNNGTVDWRFGGAGYGSLGRQQGLVDNSTSGTVQFNVSGSDQRLTVRLPADAQIGSATMRVTGQPYAKDWWNQNWLYRIPVNVTNNKAVALGEVLVDLWVDTANFSVQDVKEFRVLYKPAGNGAQEERPSQAVDEKKVSGRISEARVVFRTKALGPDQTQLYYIYMSNPNPPIPPMSMDFRPDDIRNRPVTPPAEDPPATAPGYFLEPNHIAVSGTDLYVADTGHHVVRIFDANGTLKGTIGTYGVPGKDNAHLSDPSGVAVGPDGRIYISDTQNNRVQVFFPDLKFNMSITDGAYVFMNGNTNLSGPHGIRVSSNGTIYLADTGNHALQRFSPDGKPTGVIGDAGWAGNDNDHLNSPYDVCVREDGYLMVADWNNYRVQVFDDKLAYSSTLGKAGSGNGEFMFPSGVECKKSLTYVADTVNHRVQVFYGAGQTFRQQYGTTGVPGLGVAQLNQPVAVVVDDRGAVLIADKGNNRIMRITDMTVKASATEGEYPKSPSMDIGADGLAEWSYTGTLIGPAITQDMQVRLNIAVFTAVPKKDQWGNSYVDLPIKFTSQGPGAITIDQIDIRYDCTVMVNATKQVADLLQKADPKALSVTLPIKVTALSGTLGLSNVSFVYDMPPTLLGPIPDTYGIDEDTSNARLIDLYGFFKDDIDPKENLTFGIVSRTNSTIVNVSIFAGHYVSVDSYNGTKNDHWHGTVQVVVSCTDKRGLRTDSNLFTATVRLVNHPPQFISNPILDATEGQNYSYQAQAVDVDNQRITYSLSFGPVGMVINATTGLVTWRPTAQQTGNQRVEVLADNGNIFLGKTRQSFNISVKRVNKAPIVRSTPYTDVTVGEEYVYPVVAEDPDTDALNYSLLKAPSGMTIDPKTGVITWTPKEGQVGKAKVSVAVTDGKLTARQDFNVTVKSNGRIAGIPILYLVAGVGLLLLILIIVVVAVLVSRRRKRKAVEDVHPRSRTKGRAIEEDSWKGGRTPVQEAHLKEPEECLKCGELIEHGIGYCPSCGHVIKEERKDGLITPPKLYDVETTVATREDPGPQRGPDLSKYGPQDGPMEVAAPEAIVVEAPPKAPDAIKAKAVEAPKPVIKKEPEARKKEEPSLDEILKALKK
jgi:hypothetical protein